MEPWQTEGFRSVQVIGALVQCTVRVPCFVKKVLLPGTGNF
jgi:hypothetical protein